MSNLIKFFLRSRSVVMIDPRFIRDVHGNNNETQITLASIDPDTETYRVHIIPKPVNEVSQIIESKFIEIKMDQIQDQDNQNL